MNKIRSLATLTYLVLVTLGVSLSAIIQYWRGPSKFTRKWADNMLQRWAQHSLNMAEVDLKVHGKKNVHFEQGKPYIVMCNHTSYYDIPISFVALKGCSLRMLTKKELYSTPLFGKGLFKADFPMIDRNNRRQSLKDLAHARKLMQDGIVMWVAPEGTRSTNGKLGKFKRGSFLMAIEAGATIIPMGIQGADKVWPPHTFGLNFGQKVEVFFGEPIDASVYVKNQKDMLLECVEASISNLSEIYK